VKPVPPNPTPPPGATPFAVLRQFVRPRPAAERCELCGNGLPPEHAHLLELPVRRIVCSCDACAILFSGTGASRYRRIPRTATALPGFRMSDAQWASLRVPINLAFFFRNGETNAVAALYPSPAGATEAALPLDAWPELVGQNPALAELEPDVEALLVNRLGESRDYFRAPIDECFKLVGLIRSRWRGLSGGAEVWDAVAQFFAALRERAAGGGGPARA
jgi:hypothetical protein